MNNPDQAIINQINLLIDENFTNSTFSLATLCKKVGVSRTHLHRIVKEQTQLPITLYIRNRKLEKAKSLLLTTEFRISEIAYQVGIDSPQNFSKYFIQQFNISPTEFRKHIPVDDIPVFSEPTLSIAVLPFVNMSNDQEQEYFSDGISEEIINMLTHVQSLKVTGRTSSFAFKGKNLDLRLIGKELNVNHILEGSVRKSGNKLRITAQLINVVNGYHVWSDNFDREIEDIFDIQDEISLTILNEVKIKLFGEEKENVFKRYTNNHEAYQLYLHGRYYHNKFAGTEEFNKAVEYYKAAIHLAPEYALAYSGIASCYLNLWFYRHLPPEESLPLMQQATERSLQLDAHLAESYIAIARMKLFYEWNFNDANIAFKKAIELNSNLAEAHGQYALFLGLSDNHAKAKEHALFSLNLDPFSLINRFYTGYIYWLAGDFDKAIAQGKELIALEPNFWGGHSIVGMNLIKHKKYTEASAALATALHLNYSGLTLSACGVLYGLVGEDEKARNILEKMRELNKTQPVYHYDWGIVHACLGEKDTACYFFEKSIENHEPPMLFFKYIVRDWLVKAKHDTRYEMLIRKY